MRKKEHLDWLYGLVPQSDEEQQVTIGEAVLDVLPDKNGSVYVGHFLLWQQHFREACLSQQELQSYICSFDRIKLCLPESIQQLESHLFVIPEMF